MGLIIWYAPALVMIAISAAYFWLDGPERSRTVRLLVSIHGVSAAILFLIAMLISGFTGAQRPWAAWPYLALHLVPVASILYAFVRFRGPKFLHLTQVVNIFCMAQTLVVGGMAVTGDWL